MSDDVGDSRLCNRCLLPLGWLSQFVGKIEMRALVCRTIDSAGHIPAAYLDDKCCPLVQRDDPVDMVERCLQISRGELMIRLSVARIQSRSNLHNLELLRCVDNFALQMVEDVEVCISNLFQKT